MGNEGNDGLVHEDRMKKSGTEFDIRSGEKPLYVFGVGQEWAEVGGRGRALGKEGEITEAEAGRRRGYK